MKLEKYKEGKMSRVAPSSYTLILSILCFYFISYGQSVESLMGQGNMLLQNGAYDQAVSQFRKVLERDPGNFEARFNLAFAYLNWGRNSNAVTEFQKALQVNQRCGECWGNLAIAYENLGQSDKALNALYNSVNTNPGNIEARMNLATMYANADRLNDAISQYKQIIQIDGRNLDAHINVAKCYISKNNSEEAKHYLKAAMSLNPEEAEPYWELGNIAWKKENNTQDALKLYQKAIALKPNSQVYYENLALLYEELHQNDKALETWRSYLVYLDDALKKEKINDRIQMLERGDAPSGKESPDKLFGKQDRHDEVDRLKGELREGSEVTTETKMISTESVDVMGDMNDLDQEEKSDFDFDMKKAVKKKKKESSKEE